MKTIILIQSTETSHNLYKYRTVVMLLANASFQHIIEDRKALGYHSFHSGNAI